MFAVRRLIPVAAAASLAAAVISCRAMDEPLPPAAIAGTWLYTETLADQVFNVTCNDTGTYTFDQTGGKFTGFFVQTGICRSGSSKQFNDGHGQVTNGAVTSVHVQFTAADLCSYEGLLSSTRDAVSAGTGVCDFVDSSTNNHYSLQITWQMTKQ